jgi:hypothetical protein
VIAEIVNAAALRANAAVYPPQATMMPAADSPTTVATDRASTSEPFAATRRSGPTISGIEVRSATWKIVFPAPITTVSR